MINYSLSLQRILESLICYGIHANLLSDELKAEE